MIRSAPNARLLSVAALIILCVSQASAQDARREVIARLIPGTLVMPQSMQSCMVGQLQYCTQDVMTVLTTWNAQIVEVAFPGFALADTLATASRTGETVRVTDRSNTYVFVMLTEQDADSLISDLVELPRVVYAEKNYVEVLLDQCPVEPNDPRFDDQWGLYGGNGVDADLAWCVTQGSSVKIGILDTGVDWDHEDLGGKVSGESGLANESPYHGTHVAGIAAAVGNNGVGIAGLNWAAQIDSRIVAEVERSVEEINDRIVASLNAGSAVLNNSWHLDNYSKTIRGAFADAYKRNVVTCAAMGNANGEIAIYPAAYGQGIIAVGASTQSGNRWEEPDLSNGSNFGDHIDVVAPGQHVMSTVPPELSDCDEFYDGYCELTGTSMATPHVAGIASMLLTVRPSLYNDDVEQLIRLSAVDRGQPGWDKYYGAGIANLDRALDLLVPPYTLQHRNATGGSSVGSTHVGNMVFYDVPGLSPYPHPVDRYEVQKSVTFASHYALTPSVWGRGVVTNGFSAENPNFGMGYAQPVWGTITKTGCTLSTFVYEAFNLQGQSLGYFPCEPGEVEFAYTIHGIEDLAPPSVTVVAPNGGNYVEVGQEMSIIWNLTDEYPQGVQCNVYLDGPTFYQIAVGLFVGTNGAITWEIPSFIEPGNSYRVRVVATDTNGQQGMDSSNGTFTIAESGGGHGGGPPPCEYPCGALPRKPPVYLTDLLPANPNPFNQSTRIRFSLENSDEVALRVYDVNGRVVRTVVNGFRERGAHDMMWDGRDDAGRELASGVYFVGLQTTRHRLNQKVVVIR